MMAHAAGSAAEAARASGAAAALDAADAVTLGTAWQRCLAMEPGRDAETTWNTVRVIAAAAPVPQASVAQMPSSEEPSAPSIAVTAPRGPEAVDRERGGGADIPAEHAISPPVHSVGIAAPRRRRLRDELTPRRDPPRWRLGGLLGRGGQGAVHVAEQVALRREVAIKVAGSGDDSGTRAMLRVEARVPAWIDHPHIVTVHDAGEDFLVMQRIRGRTLSEHIAEAWAGGSLDRGRLPDLIEMLVSVADAVAAAHAQGVLHRDLKPSNVMVGAHGVVLVCDWGLALGFRDDAPAELPRPDPASACAGTPAYLAPEMARGLPRELGPHSDVFLLGGCLYRVLTNQPPHPGASASQALRAAALGVVTPVQQVQPRAPAALADLVAAACALHSARRPTAAAFAAGLRAWLRGESLERTAIRARERSEAALSQAQRSLPGTHGTLRHDGHAAQRAPQTDASCDHAPAAVSPQALAAAVLARSEAAAARAAWPTAPGLTDLVRRAAACHAELALAAGDLALAGAVIAEDLATDGALADDLRARIAAVQQQRARQQLRERLAIGLVILLALCVIGESVLAWWLSP